MNIISAYPWVYGSVCQDWGHMLCASLILSKILCWNFHECLSAAGPSLEELGSTCFSFSSFPVWEGAGLPFPSGQPLPSLFAFSGSPSLRHPCFPLSSVSLPRSCLLLILDLFNLVFLALGYFLSFCVSLAI